MTLAELLEALLETKFALEDQRSRLFVESSEIEPTLEASERYQNIAFSWHTVKVAVNPKLYLDSQEHLTCSENKKISKTVNRTVTPFDIYLNKKSNHTNEYEG